MLRRSNENRTILTYESTYILSDLRSHTHPLRVITLSPETLVTVHSFRSPLSNNHPRSPQVIHPQILRLLIFTLLRRHPHIQKVTAYVYMSCTFTLTPSRASNGLLVKLPAPSKSYATSTTGASCVGMLTYAVSVTFSPQRLQLCRSHPGPAKQ